MVFCILVRAVLHILISNYVPFCLDYVFPVVSKGAEIRLFGLLYRVPVQSLSKFRFSGLLGLGMVFFFCFFFICSLLLTIVCSLFVFK